MHMYSVHGWGPFCMNYCLNAAVWMLSACGTADVLWMTWPPLKHPGHHDQDASMAAFSSLALVGLMSLIFLLAMPHRFSIGFRSGRSLLANQGQYPMVIEPGFGCFGSVCRCQVLLENKISITKVPESGEKLERHRMQDAWSPVWSFHNLCWFGEPCHLLVLVHCALWRPESTQPSIRTF